MTGQQTAESHGTRWCLGRRRPSAGEIAHRLAMARRHMGESVQWYVDENGFRGWLWFCTECRCSGTGWPTREIARSMRAMHEKRCDGKEPAWLRVNRARYAKELDERRRLPAAHRSSSRAVRISAWAGQHARERGER